MLVSSGTPFNGEISDFLFDNSSCFSPATIEAYATDLRDFARFALATQVNSWPQVEHALIGSYTSSLKSHNYSKATINRRLAALSALFQYLLEKRTVTTNPTEEVVWPRIQQQPHPLSSQELANLLHVVGEDVKTGSPIALRNSALVLLLYATGPKISELKGLNVDDVDLKERVASYESSKGIKRPVPIAKEEAVQAVQSYLANGRPKLEKVSGGQALFLIQSTGQSGSRPTRQWLWAILKNYTSKAGIGDSLISNALRDTYAVERIREGAALIEICQLLGTVPSAAYNRYRSFLKT